MANPENLKPFKKNDARINRKGRPKTFDALRGLAQQIAHEIAKADDGQPVIVDGQPITAVEAILRIWSMSANPALQMKFVEVAYGKVPDELQVAGAESGQPIPVIVLQPGYLDKLK